jgi:putrescine transport system ATP-binding protein
VNLLEGRISATPASADEIVIESSAGRLRARSGAAFNVNDTVWLALRPEKLRLGREPPARTGENCVAGRVWDIGYLGDLSVYKVRLDSGLKMTAAVANMTRAIERPIGLDDEVWLSWTVEAGVVLTR